MDLAIFDLGNVLFHTDFEKAISVWATECGLQPQPIRQRFTVGKHMEAFERGGILPEEFFAHLARQLDVSIATESLMRGWNAIYGEVISRSYEAIRALAEVTACVALTNTNVTHCAIWRRRYRSELAVFRKTYVSSEMGMRKPERQIFKHVLAEWDLKPSRVVFFDDNRDNTEAADALGMNAVLVTSEATVSSWVQTYLRSR